MKNYKIHLTWIVVACILITGYEISITKFKKEIQYQKEYIKELEWENENNYIYCEVEE